MQDKSIIIIGAGIAGLCAGSYAQMNGYRSRIFEMHSLPGGLCTAWNRRGYTIDGCVHFLIGSSPQGIFHNYWQEVGLLKDRKFIHHEAINRYESKDGQVFCFYTDIERLHQHMLDISPADRPLIEEFIAGLRFFKAYQPPIDAIPELMGPLEGIKFIFQMLPNLPTLQKWAKISIHDFANRFQNKLIREAFLTSLVPDFSMMLMMGPIAWQAQHNADYPIGGSLPLARSLEQRYRSLGGEINYNTRVEKILTEGDRAVGVRLENGEEQRADIIISAADGYSTLFKMLGDHFLDEKTRANYRELPVFPALLYVSMGVKRTFDEPSAVSGLVLELDQPVHIGGRLHNHLPVRILNFDPTLAPAGKTTVIVSVWTDYDYWNTLRANRQEYEAKKEEALQTIIRLLERRWPGLAEQVEMSDVATPVTFERYTGNWQGSTTGWLSTPRAALMQMSKTLPKLKNFYLIGQWTEPGGGLPGGVRSGRGVIRIICHKDKKLFTTNQA